MEIGEIGRRSRRPVQGGLIGPQLHQVPGHEPGGEAQAAQDLDQQPGTVPARPERLAESLVGGLHARLHSGGVGDRAGDELVEGDEELDYGLALGAGPVGCRGPVRQPPVEHGAGLVEGKIGGQLPGQRRVVRERVASGAVLHEEVERVDDDQVRHYVDRHRQAPGRLREHQPGHVVAERVLLPVDEMVGWGDLQRVGQDGRTAMGRGPQAHDVGRKPHRPVKLVRRLMFERDPDAHAGRSTAEGDGSIWK